MMRLALLVLAPSLALSLSLAAPPLRAEEPKDGEDGFSLMEEGAKLLLQGLMTEMQPALDEMQGALDEMKPVLEDWAPQLREIARLMGDLENYHAPEFLPNGDILIRRKTPLLPEGLRPDTGPNGEIEL